MALKEFDDVPVHLVWELLLDEMTSFSHVYDLQIRHKALHRSTLDVVLHSRKLETVVLFPHHQQCRDLDFGIEFVTRIVE